MRIKVDGGGYDGQEWASVIVDRDRKLISIKPRYSREVVTYPLGAVAKMLLWKAAKERANDATKLEDKLNGLQRD